MTTLQNQITQSLDGLSEDSLRFILNMIQRFVIPVESKNVGINYAAVEGKKTQAWKYERTEIYFRWPRYRRVQ